jgi:hypothetical protein
VGIGHEVHDELGEYAVENRVLERERLRGRHLDAHAWQSCPARFGERLRWVGGHDAVGVKHRNELGGQRSWPAADVERALSGAYPGRFDQGAPELAGVAADVAVVRLGGGAKGGGAIHAVTLPPPRAAVKGS